MTSVAPSFQPVWSFRDNNGNALAGGTLAFYVAGTSIPQAVYTDSTGSVTLPNPVTLNSRGETALSTGSSCGIWMPPGNAYKIVLSDSFGNVLWTVDNYIAPVTQIGGLVTVPNIVVTSTSVPASGAGLYQPSANALGFFSNGVGRANLSATGDWIGRGLSVARYKVNDTVRSTTIPALDPDLQYTTPGAGTFSVEMVIFLAADAVSAANGLLANVYSTNITGPAGPNRYAMNGVLNAASAFLIQKPIGTVIGTADLFSAALSNGSNDWVTISANVTTGSASTIGFQWSEYVTGTGNLTVRAGSYMTITQLSA